jgi:hypothetical protein
MFDKKKKIEQVLEQPTDNKVRKSNYTTKIVYENDKFQVKRVTKFKVYSELFHKWLTEKPDLSELCPLSVLKEDEPKKQISISVIIQKSIVNEDHELIDGFFLYQATYKVSSEYPAVYLSVANNQVVQTHLISGESFPLPVFEDIKGVSVELSTKPKQIKRSEALAMEKQGVSIFDRQNGEFRHYISHGDQ